MAVNASFIGGPWDEQTHAVIIVATAVDPPDYGWHEVYILDAASNLAAPVYHWRADLHNNTAP